MMRALVTAMLALVVGCAGADKRPDPVAMPERAPVEVKETPQPEPEPEPVPVEAPPPDPVKAAEPDPTPVADTAAASERVGNRSSDGIDNETPIPTDGPARDAFLRAVTTAQNDPGAAVNQFTDAATRTTYFYAAYYNAGAAAERAGNVAEAERQYKKSLEVRPDYGPALTNLMLLMHNNGRRAEGDRLVDGALAKHEDKAGPHVAAAVRALGQGRYSDVEKEALRAVRIDERNVSARRLMARVFYEQKRYETAKFALENALVLEPGNALLHLEMGHVQLKLETNDKALEAFQTAARLRPELAEAHENAGVLLLASGDPENALISLRDNARLRGDSARAQMLLGNALRGNKLYQEAEAAYLRALKRDSKLDEIHFNLGILYMDNELPNIDELARLKKAAAELEAYDKGAKPRGRVKERVDDYQKSVDRRISRIERQQARAKKAAAKAAKEGAKSDEGNPEDDDDVE